MMPNNRLICEVLNKRILSEKKAKQILRGDLK